MKEILLSIQKEEWKSKHSIIPQQIIYQSLEEFLQIEYLCIEKITKESQSRDCIQFQSKELQFNTLLEIVSKESSFTIVLPEEKVQKKSISIPLYIQSKERNKRYTSNEFIQLFNVNETIKQLVIKQLCTFDKCLISTEIYDKLHTESKKEYLQSIIQHKMIYYNQSNNQ